MPVDYSPILQASQGPDIGNILARSAQLEGIRQNNLLGHAQLDDIRRSEQFRNTLSQNPQASFEDLSAVDPNMAIQYQNARTGMQNNSLAQDEQRTVNETRQMALRQEKARYLSGVLGAIDSAFNTKGDEAGMAMAKYYWPEVKQKGFFPGMDNLSDDPQTIKSAVKQFYEHAQLAATPQEQSGIIENPESLGFERGTVVQRGPNGTLNVLQSPQRQQPGSSFEVMPDGTVRYSSGGAPLQDVAGRVPPNHRLTDPSNPMLGVEPIPGGPADPVNQATGDERKYAGYVESMRSAERNLTKNNYEPSGTDLIAYGVLADETASSATKLAANKMLSPKARQFYQAAQAWLDPLARARTGAAMPASEFLRFLNTHIPTAGDDEGTIAQKAQQRSVEMQGIVGMSGRAMPKAQKKEQSKNPVIDEQGNPIQ
jgi:hypothetical protein